MMELDLLAEDGSVGVEKQSGRFFPRRAVVLD
jgi:hypothetical protein